jgi:hypothetical protein
LDRQDLSRLAERGVAAFPPANLSTLAEWCWDFGESSGDARYCSLWRTLSMVAAPFDQDDALSSAVVARIDSVLRTSLPDVLTADSAADGSLLARALRERLLDAVGAPD